MIFVWDAITAKRVHFMTLPNGSRSASALAFSPDGKYLAASDMSNHYHMHLFDLTQTDKKGKCKMIWKNQSNNKQIFCIRWNPFDHMEFASVGEHHLYFWN